MRLFTLFVCLALPAVSVGQELKLPDKVQGQPGSFVVIRAETDCKVVRWLMLDDGATLLPPELLKDSKAAIIFTPKAGRFRVLAYAAKGDEPTEPRICVMEIGDPAPPTPPAPPAPTDPLAARLQAAYAADPAPVAVKQKQIAILYGVYGAMAEHCQSDTTLKTLGDVLTELQNTAKWLGLVSDGLIECRKMIAAEVGSLGTSPGMAFDATLRAATVACFGKIAKALELVK